MAFSGGGRFGGGGMGALLHQQRSISDLREGKPSIPRTLALVWQALRAYRWQLVLGTLVMTLGVGVGLIPPLLIRELIDTAIPQHDLRLILLLGGGLVLFPIGSAPLGFGQNCVSIVIAQGVIVDMPERVNRHTQSDGLDYFT